MEVSSHYLVRTARTFKHSEHGTVAIMHSCVPRRLWELLGEEWVDWEDELDYHVWTEDRSCKSDPDLGGATLPEYYPIILYESGCCPDPAWPKSRAKPRSIVLPESDSGSELFLLDHEGGNNDLIPIDWGIPGHSFPCVVRHQYKWSEDDDKCLQLEKERLWSDQESTREKDAAHFLAVYGREPDPVYNQGYYFQRVY